MLSPMLLLPAAAALLCFLVPATHGQVFNFGACPKVVTKPDFDVSQYIGLWYEVQRYYPIYFEMGLSCGQANYSLNADGSINVRNRGFNKQTGEVSLIYGAATTPNPRAPGKLKVEFPSASNMGMGNYWVFDTDYTDYAIVYSCLDILPGLIHADILWILGRTPSLPRAELDVLRARLLTAGIRIDPLRDVPHQDCPYVD